MKLWFTLLGCCGLLMAMMTISAFGQQLDSYLIEPKSITVSGVSSGAAMAVQLHVAYSSTFTGMGAIAGGPYWCAMNNYASAAACLLTPGLISLDALWAGTRLAADLGTIDNPKNLNGSRVWIFAGTKDLVVNPGAGVKAKQFYEGYMSNDTIVFVGDIPAEHAWITNFYGAACDHLGIPFINNCNFDAAGEMLRHFYYREPLKPRAQNFTSSNLFPFNQGLYTPLGIDPWHISMGSKGFVYVPTACQDGKTPCKLHVCLTGCLGFYDLVGTLFIDHTGFNEWAETNNIIVLWGYTGPEYATQWGPQMITIKNMISALAGKK